MNLKPILAVFCLLSPVVVSGAKEPVVDTLGSKCIATTPADLLKGRVSGVRVSATDGNPNGPVNVNIRGLNTLRGDSQPLWIVDGAVIGSSINQNLNAFYQSGGMTINGDVLPDYSGRFYTAPLNNFSWLNPYDIESIEVVKDLSETSMYGMRGANGVIIVKTRKPANGTRNIWLNSNVGVDMAEQKSDAFRTGILTTHDIGVNGVFGTKSFYNVSGFIRYNNTAIRNTGSTCGGLALNLETSDHERFQFGLNSFFNYGNYKSTAGTNFQGQPSTMILARYPDGFTADKLGDWLNSYDDEVKDYRTVNSVWLNINIIRTLDLKFSGSADYQNQTRYFWFGNGTSFGKEFSGAASILNNSLLDYNFNAELTLDRSFAVKHHLKASAVFDLNGNVNRTNAMCGTDFDLPYLRGKGLSSSESLHSIMKFSRSYTQFGGYMFLHYDYDGMAGISGTARCDKTRRFDDKPLWLPSAEAYVDFRQIFLRSNETVSALRLKGGYGKAGKEAVMPYEYIYAYIDNIPDIEAGSAPYYEGMNRLLSEEWNIGADLGFIGNRFTLSFKYYDKQTDDNFSIFNFGKVLSGMWVSTRNREIVGTRTSVLRNNGFEIDADCDIIQTPKVRWNIAANASVNINKVISFDLPVTGVTSSDTGTDSLGRMIPKWYGGFSTALSLYGLTIDARFSGAADFEIVNANRMIEDGVDEISAEYFERGDWLRLDCLSFSYSIPMKARWIKSLCVNLSAHNLFTATKYSGWNPDVNCFGVNSRKPGIDYGSYPLRRQAVLGISLRF